MAELVEMRALDRARQHDHRLDRETRVGKGRTVSRRGIEEDGASGPTVIEIDRHRVGARERVARDQVERLVADGVIDPGAAEAAVSQLRDALERAPLPPAKVLAAAWNTALDLIRLSPNDWQPGRYVLAPLGMAKFESMVVRAVILMRAGDVLRAGTVDGWWTAAWRSVLADHELGIVIAAADDLDGRPTTEHAIEMTWVESAPDLPELRDHPRLGGALDAVIGEYESNDGRDFARVAVERWQRLKRAGWDRDNISRKQPERHTDS